MFKWLRRIVERVTGTAPTEPPRRKRRRKRQPPTGGPVGPVGPSGDDFDVEPSEEWYESDSEWYETHPDLIRDVITDLLLDLEAGGYL